MAEEGMKDTVNTHTVMIQGFAVGGYVEKCIDRLEEATAAKYVMTPYTLSRIMVAMMPDKKSQPDVTLLDRLQKIVILHQPKEAREGSLLITQMIEANGRVKRVQQILRFWLLARYLLASFLSFAYSTTSSL
jgi:hypothetical protein